MKNDSINLKVSDSVELPATIAEFALDNQDAFEGVLNFDFDNQEEVE